MDQRASKAAINPTERAIGAFMCALASPACLISLLPALILGHSVRAHAKSSGDKRGFGLATAALAISYGVMGLVFVAVVAAVIQLPFALKRWDQDLRAHEREERERREREEQEARPKPPAPVERGPLPARLRGPLPFNHDALAKEPDRYRPLTYAKAQVCRGEGDARERYLEAFTGSYGVEDDGLRHRYSSWISSCDSPDACRWLRKRVRSGDARLRERLEEQLDECSRPRDAAPEQATLSWDSNPFEPAEQRPSAEQQASCARDASKRLWERAACTRDLARSDWTAASPLARELGAAAAALTRKPGAPYEIGASRRHDLALLGEYPSLAALEQRLQGIGLLPQAARAKSSTPPVSVEELLEAHHRLHGFDVETGTFPNRHDLLASELAALTDLRDVYFEEIPPPEDHDDGAYRLRAFTAQHEYSVVAENHGDWYDVDAVLRLLDRMLADAGSELRMHTLTTEDQWATVIAAPPAAVSAAEQLGLLLTESSHAAARESGKAFEDKVRKQLGTGAVVR